MGILLNPRFEAQTEQNPTGPSCTAEQDMIFSIRGGVDDLLVAVTDHNTVTMKTPEDDEELYVRHDGRQVNYFVRLLESSHFRIEATCNIIHIAQDGEYEGLLYVTKASGGGEVGLRAEVTAGRLRASLRYGNRAVAFWDATFSTSLRVVGLPEGNVTGDVSFLLEIEKAPPDPIQVNLDKILPSGGRLRIPSYTSGKYSLDVVQRPDCYLSLETTGLAGLAIDWDLVGVQGSGKRQGLTGHAITVDAARAAPGELAKATYRCGDRGWRTTGESLLAEGSAPSTGPERNRPTFVRWWEAGGEIALNEIEQGGFGLFSSLSGAILWKGRWHTLPSFTPPDQIVG